MRFIKIKRAREHNLKNISVKIPIGKITVITGDSGSGKSSLAFDVLYTEAKRRYLSALTGDTADLASPDVEGIEPVPAAIALRQNYFNRNPRSTLATLTGFGDMLKGIYELAGEFCCPICLSRIDVRSRENVVRQLMNLKDGSRLVVKVPLAGGTDGKHLRQSFKDCIQQGFLRCEINGQSYYLEDLVDLDSIPQGDVLVVIDRIVKRPGSEERITDSLRQAIEFSRGIAWIDLSTNDPANRALFNAEVIRFAEIPYCFTCARRYTYSDDDVHSASVSRDSAAGELIRKISGITIQEAFALPLSLLAKRLCSWLPAWEAASRPEFLAAAAAAKELLENLGIFHEMGLDYLSLGSSFPSLSSGEMLKVRLGSLLSRKLSGILYVLDEPLSGLEEQERQTVRDKIGKLKAAGNTVVVVEHDRKFIEGYADHLIELGPDAGEFGGQVIYEGDGSGYEIKSRQRSSAAHHFLTEEVGETTQTSSGISGGTANHIRVKIKPEKNLRLEFVDIPVATMTGIRGPSGSGKSTLAGAVFQSLKGINSRSKKADGRGRASGLRPVETPFGHIWFMDEDLPRGSSASVIATFIGIYRHLSALLARTPQARARGITAAYLSLSRKGGRCEKCRGSGSLIMEPEFLPPVKFVCDACAGNRFSSDALSIRYKGLNISEMLRMTVSQAAGFFKNMTAVRQPLECLERTGLGYLQIGQSLLSLSGGERQRLKLAAVLSKKKGKGRKDLFILDNVARGLSSRDLRNLIGLLNELVECGHSVIVIENNALLLENCGCIIEMGPGSGPYGGKILSQGPWQQ